MLKQLFFYLIATFLAICISSASYSAEKPLLYVKNNVLAAGIYNNALTSSDLTLVVRADVGGKTIFDEGYEIVYIIPDKDIKDWTTVNFNTSDWEKGTSGIGYSDGDDNTTVPAGIACVYVRYYFNIPNAKDSKEVTFW